MYESGMAVVCYHASARPPLAAPRVVVRVSISCITFDMKDEIIFVHCASPERGCTWLVRVLNTLFSFKPGYSLSPTRNDNRKTKRKHSIHVAYLGGHVSNFPGI